MLERVDVNCPVCGSARRRTKYGPWVNVDDPERLYGAASGVPGTQTLVSCLDCRMIYESPRPADAIILKGYTSSEESGHDSQYGMRVHSFYRALVSLGSRIPGPGARVLDVGTAGGAFLEAAARFGYDATGLEPSEFLVEQGKRRGLKLEVGTVDKNTFEPASFDMVCLWDVIEHLCDPAQALSAIRRLLRPNGVLLVNFPDIGTLQARLAGRRYWWILSVHLHHFTRQTLGELCRRQGFEVFHTQRYWQTLEFGYLEQMAIHYRMPLSQTLYALTPERLKKLPMPYYASQTTALARIAP